MSDPRDVEHLPFYCHEIAPVVIRRVDAKPRAAQAAAARGRAAISGLTAALRRERLAAKRAAEVAPGDTVQPLAVAK